MSYKLIALDMDGTLLHRGKVTDANAKAVKAALQAGYYVVLATGRPVGQVRRIAAELGLRLPLVINNGSEVWKSPEELHSRHVLEPEWVERIFSMIRKYGNDVTYWAHTVEGKQDIVYIPGQVRSYRWLQIAVRSERTDYLEEIRSEVQAWDSLEISNSHITNIEFNPKGINKASGLREVCKLLGVSMQEVIAMGDSLNDIPMIQQAGLGVAMGNAQESVKQAACIVAPSNEDDGVANIITNYLLS